VFLLKTFIFEFNSPTFDWCIFCFEWLNKDRFTPTCWRHIEVTRCFNCINAWSIHRYRYFSNKLEFINNVSIPTKSRLSSISNMPMSNNTVRIRSLTTNLRNKPESNTPVIFDTELRSYSNGITVCIRPCTMNIRSRIRCRIAVSNIFGKYWPVT